MDKNKLKVLRFLNKAGEVLYGRGFYCFAPICKATGFERQEVRRICRYLARKGFAVYSRGLWTEEGEPAGAGYAITKEGENFLNKGDFK